MHYTDQYRNLNDDEKTQLWESISAQIAPIPATKVSFNLFPYPKTKTQTKKSSLIMRDYAVAALFVLLLSGTGAFAAAAEQSLPTSPLYSVKIHITEPLQSLTKLSPESKIHWDIARTERRMEETKQLLKANTLTPQLAQDLAKKISEHTADIQQNIGNLSGSDQTQSIVLSASLIETIEKKNEEIVNVINTNIEAHQNTILTNETISLQNAQSVAIQTVLDASKAAETSTQTQSDTLIAQQKIDNSAIIKTETAPEDSLSISQIQFVLILQDIAKDLAILEPVKAKESIAEEKPILKTEEITISEIKESIKSDEAKPILTQSDTVKDKTEPSTASVKEDISNTMLIEKTEIATPTRVVSELDIAKNEFALLNALLPSTNEKTTPNYTITMTDITRGRTLRKNVHQLVLDSEKKKTIIKAESGNATVEVKPESENKEKKSLLNSLLPVITGRAASENVKDIPNIGNNSNLPTVTQNEPIQLPETLEIKQTKENRR
jgi:hypothetical protein